MLGLVTADFQHFVRAGGFFFYSQIMDKEKTQGREREQGSASVGYATLLKYLPSLQLPSLLWDKVEVLWPAREY